MNPVCYTVTIDADAIGDQETVEGRMELARLLDHEKFNMHRALVAEVRVAQEKSKSAYVPGVAAC